VTALVPRNIRHAYGTSACQRTCCQCEMLLQTGNCKQVPLLFPRTAAEEDPATYAAGLAAVPPFLVLRKRSLRFILEWDDISEPTAQR